MEEILLSSTFSPRRAQTWWISIQQLFFRHRKAKAVTFAYRYLTNQLIIIIIKTTVPNFIDILTERMHKTKQTER